MRCTLKINAFRIIKMLALGKTAVLQFLLCFILFTACHAIDQSTKIDLLHYVLLKIQAISDWHRYGISDFGMLNVYDLGPVLLSPYTHPPSCVIWRHLVSQKLLVITHSCIILQSSARRWRSWFLTKDMWTNLILMKMKYKPNCSLHNKCHL